jgi:hypothetical protein
MKFTGKPNKDPAHPDYVPSIFTTPQKGKRKRDNLTRYYNVQLQCCQINYCAAIDIQLPKIPK